MCKKNIFHWRLLLVSWNNWLAFLKKIQGAVLNWVILFCRAKIVKKINGRFFWNRNVLLLRYQFDWLKNFFFSNYNTLLSILKKNWQMWSKFCLFPLVIQILMISVWPFFISLVNFPTSCNSCNFKLNVLYVKNTYVVIILLKIFSLFQVKQNIFIYNFSIKN